MPLVIHPATDDGAIALVGELDAATASDLADRTEALVAGAGEALVLDVADLDYLDSAGIRALLRLENRLKARAARLVLRDVAPKVHRMLRYSGLGEHFACASGARPLAEGA